MNGYDLGRAIERDGMLVWEKGGRRLTEWEQRMRLSRGDIWMPIEGAIYRLGLPYLQVCELENLIGGSTYRLWSMLPEIDRPDVNVGAPVAHCVQALRLALAGGARGVRNGETFAVAPVMATTIAESVADGPIAGLVRLVRAVMAVTHMGRPATADEVAAFSIPAGPPITPQWALEHRA